ncbi:FemAB family protein [Planococcus massiliensis]|uniref:Lipid II:glycine glycyltransferase n=1 Tax=Planococcus massiliensis TaxID=1499687 RepID=A0A098EJU5_9BACL|nr:GNAT family N-acetyltransferase [Planococcus massiliensis]CEG22090.1 FemAB family protein [Planococcus massiliensis]
MTLKDIYFEKPYARLYEAIEKGSCEVFEFKHPLGSIRHLFIRCELETKLEGHTYYELKTPYGYGGPMISDCLERDKPVLVKEFQAAFQKYCVEQRIVREIVRFHPVFSNAEDFRGCYDVSFKRKTTGTNLELSEDPVQSEFSKSCRRNIKKALKSGVSFKLTLQPDSLGNFMELYYETMKRNQAEDIYYFDKAYFDKCLANLREHILLTEVIYEGKTIGMGINFLYGKLISTHLSGTFEEYHHLSPASILQYALTIWGKENNFTLIHDGGGRTSDPEDSLFLFKKQFGKNTEFSYYIGYKIWNEEIHRELNKFAQLTQTN